MTEVKETAAAVANGAVKKHRKRGINNETRAVTRLKFHEKDAAQNGLFIGHLDSVSVEWSINEDAKAFTGLRTPRLVFRFASNHSKVEERRWVDKTIFPVESNVDTIEGGKDDWQVNNVFAWIKHILDTFYFKGREMTEDEENALSLTFDDVEEDADGNLNYVAVDPQEVLNGYQHVFENAAAMLNGSFNLPDGETAKPVFKDANGKPINLWIKLLRATRNRKGDWTNVERSGDLAFTAFVGQGAIEIAKTTNGQAAPPAILRIDAAKESVTPKQVNKAPSVGAPNMPGMNIPGMAMPNMNGNAGTEANGAFAGASDDMPF